MKEVSIDRIKKKFPKPRTFDHGKIMPGSYCVGGALMSFAGFPDSDGYPDVDEIAAFLMMANPRLSSEDAEHYASEIVRLNDSGNFSLAWEKAEQAFEVS